MENFTRYPNRIIDAADIGTTELLVYLAIARHADRLGNARLSHETIAKRAACSKSTVMPTVVKLQGREALEFTPGRGTKATEYRLLDYVPNPNRTPPSGTAGDTTQAQNGSTPRDTARPSTATASGTPDGPSGTPDGPSGTRATPSPALLGGPKIEQEEQEKPRAGAHAREAPADATSAQPRISSSKKDETPTALQPGWYKGLDAELGAPSAALAPDRLKELIGLARRPPDEVNKKPEAVDKKPPAATPLRPIGANRYSHRDRVADDLYMAVEDADYAAALKAVKKLRAAGVPDDVILKAAAAAAETGAPTLGYVAAVARSWAGAEPVTSALAPTTNGDGHVNGGVA